MDLFQWFNDNKVNFSVELNGYKEPPVNQYLSILPLIQSSPGRRQSKVLDLGCGNAMLLKFLELFSGQEIVPYGIEKELLPYKWAITKTFPYQADNFQLGDVANYQFNRGPFSEIIASPVYIIDYERRRKFIQDCIANLLPEGRLICLAQSDVLSESNISPGDRNLTEKLERRFFSGGLGLRYSQGAHIAFGVYDKPSA